MAMRPVPSKFPVSQGFYGQFSNKLTGGSGHGAIDFACPVGTPVVAPEDGTVVFASWCWNLPGGPNDWPSRWYQLKPAVGNRNAGGGIMTIIRNDIGSVWILAHLNDNNIAPAGTQVKKGQVIGYSGNTGSSTGPHLHVGLVPARANWSNGFYGAIDPSPWLTEAYQIRGASSNTATKPTATSSLAALPKYTLDHRESKNYYTPAQTLSAYGIPRKVTGVTIHWWGDPKTAGNHDGVANYLARPGGNTSAHYVVSKGRVTKLVDPNNAAWHAGHATGNANTIGIECNPKDIEGTLPTVAALIRDLEKTYGDLKVYRHKDWSATECPGGYSSKVNDIVNLVNNAPSTKEQTLEEWIVSNEDKVRKIIREEVMGTLLWSLDPRNKNANLYAERLGKAVQDIVIPAKGDAKGKMTMLENLAWSRHDRAASNKHREATTKALAALANGLTAILEQLDEHKAEHDKAENDKTEDN